MDQNKKHTRSLITIREIIKNRKLSCNVVVGHNWMSFLIKGISIKNMMRCCGIVFFKHKKIYFHSIKGDCRDKNI